MKSLFAFLFVIGAFVTASPFHRYGWEDGLEYVYRYESQVLTGIPDIRKEQAGGVKLVSTVKVQSMPDYTLRIKFEDPRLTSFNEVVVPKTESGRVLPEGEGQDELPGEFRKYLMTPFMARLKGGRIEGFMVPQHEPVTVTNIKRAFLTQIYMDISGYVNAGLEKEQVGEQLGRAEKVLKAELSGHKRSADGLREFVTYEKTIQGECKTIYSVSEVPSFKVAEMEELWKIENRGEASAQRSFEAVAGEGICEGKRHFKVTKTKDFNKCKIRPVYQSWIGLEGDCDVSKSSCGAVYGHMARFTYYLCGDSLHDFTIRKILMNDEKVVYPLGYRTDEKVKSVSKATMELLEKKPFSSSGPMSLPSDAKMERDLIFKFPVQESSAARLESAESTIASPEAMRESEDRYGFVPILPMPELTSAPHSLVPRTLPQEEIVQKAREMILEIARLMYRSPESCGTQEDVVGLLMTVVKHMRHLGLEHLKKLESEIPEEHRFRQVFYEVLVKIGTNPSVMLFKERLMEGKMSFLSESELMHLVQGTIRNVRTPTPELMRELVKMVKALRSKLGSSTRGSSVFTVALLQLSNLFYKAYVHPSNPYTKYPARIYGVFGTSRSEVLLSEYLPFLETLIKETGSMIEGQRDLEAEKIRLVAVVALGKLGVYESIKVLTDIVSKDQIEDYYSMPFERALAVYSLKRVGKQYPSRVRMLLMPIIMNPAEHDQVRVAAISVLPYTRPATAHLQKLVMLTWEDKLSQQVSAFVESTIENLAHSPVPELVVTGRKAAAVRHLLKPILSGRLQYSHNHHSENLIGYLDAVFSQKVHVTHTRDALMPSRISISRDLLGVFGAWKIRGPSFTAYTQGLDRIIDDLLHGKVKDKVSEQIKEIAEELQMKKGKEYSPRAFFMTRLFGFEYAQMIDSSYFAEILESAGASLAGRGLMSKEFSVLRGFKLVEADSLGPSPMGLPYVFQTTATVLLTANGTVESSAPAAGEMSFMAKAKVMPIINFKTQVDAGALIPFTQKFVGVGIEMGAHSSLALEVKAKLEKNDIKLVVKVPEERYTDPAETLHAFVMPYTVVDSYVSMKPTTLSSNKKPILTGLPLKTVEKQLFPRSLGLFCELKLESDNEFVDLASYYEKIREHSPVSIMTFPVLLVSTLKRSSTKIVFSPAKSETKEIEFILKLGSKMHGGVTVGQKVEEIREAIATHEMHSLKKALDSLLSETSGLEAAAAARMVHLDTVLKSESGRKIVKAGVVLGYKPLSQHSVKSVLALDVKPEESSLSYGILWEAKLEMPKVEYRWNLEKLMEQPLAMKFDSKIKFGPRIGGETEAEHEIRMEVDFTKTREQIESVRESPEYKKCEQEVREGKLLSPVCMKARHQAASLNKVKVGIEMPRRVYEMRLWKMLEGVLIAKYFPMVEHFNYMSTVREVRDEEIKKITLEAVTNRNATELDLALNYDGRSFNIRKIPVPPILGWWMPVSVRNSLSQWILQRSSGNQIPSSCRVEPEFIGTFDNVTYPYTLNDCAHVLVMDRKAVIPVAVVARTYKTGGRSLKVLAGKFDVELTPIGGSGSYSGSGSSSYDIGYKSGMGMEVKVNERQISLERGQTFTEKCSKTGRIIFEIKRYMDDVYQIFVLEQGLEVLANGKHIEVSVPQTMRARSAGLCGDLNGEKSTDLKSPRMCIMKSKVAGVAYMLNKDGNSARGVAPSCSGIPAELKHEYEEEERECVTDRVAPTNLRHIVKALPYLVRPKVASHAIVLTRFDVCLSRETIDIRKDANSKRDQLPVYKKPKVLSFVCLPKQSSEAHSLLKRAMAGENLASTLKSMPLYFKKHVHGDLSQFLVPGLNDRVTPYLEGSSIFSNPLIRHELNEEIRHDLNRENRLLEQQDLEAYYDEDYTSLRHGKKYRHGKHLHESPSALELEELEDMGGSYPYLSRNHPYQRMYHHLRNGASLIEEELEDSSFYRNSATASRRHPHHHPSTPLILE